MLSPVSLRVWNLYSRIGALFRFANGARTLKNIEFISIVCARRMTMTIRWVGAGAVYAHTAPEHHFRNKTVNSCKCFLSVHYSYLAIRKGLPIEHCRVSIESSSHLFTTPNTHRGLIPPHRIRSKRWWRTTECDDGVWKLHYNIFSMVRQSNDGKLTRNGCGELEMLLRDSVASKYSTKSVSVLSARFNAL